MSNVKFTCSKIFKDYPFAHRQPTHDGHCAFIHGHNWDFEITFAAEKLDGNGFVIDFGKLDFLKDWLKEKFDHTCVIPSTDPKLETMLQLHRDKLIDLRVLTSAGCEGLAGIVLEMVNDLVQKHTEGRVNVVEVTLWEDSKNYATARH